MKQLLLDLRGNGGGLLDQAIEVADQFVPGESKIVETRGRTPSSFNSYFSSGVYEELGMPVIVLVNGGSASASEILSGAIQDHDVGLVVGEPTWGKGLVQTVYSLPYGAGLALTTARYYTPSGRLIQRDYASYWDYYTQYGADPDEEAAEEVEEREVFYTDLGREVYGGGGITPDHVVEPQELSPFLQRLIGRSAFFQFGVELNTRIEVEGADWQPDDSHMDQFAAWLRDKEYATDEEIAEGFADAESADYARSRLRYEVLTTALGLEAGHRALAAADNQIREALELFPEASALLTSRSTLESQIAEQQD